MPLTVRRESDTECCSLAPCVWPSRSPVTCILVGLVGPVVDAGTGILGRCCVGNRGGAGPTAAAFIDSGRVGRPRRCGWTEAANDGCDTGGEACAPPAVKSRTFVGDFDFFGEDGRVAGSWRLGIGFRQISPL